MTPDERNLLSESVYTGLDCVWVGNGYLLPIKHVGSRYVSTVAQPLVLTNILHVLKSKHNLLSVKQLCQDNNCIVVFDDPSVCVKDKTLGRSLLHASSIGNVYPLAIPKPSTSAFTAILDPATS